MPRGWRPTDQASYPGVLLWMMRSQPEGRMALTAETFTHELYCSWPDACRFSKDSLPAKYACALRQKLTEQHMKVGPTQAGPKENDAAGLSSVWFEYDDGKHFLRQAVALSHDPANSRSHLFGLLKLEAPPDHVVSLLLSTASTDARLSLVRSFDQALRSLQRFAPVDIAGAVDAAVIDAGIGDGAIPVDASKLDAGTTFESAPVPKVSPIGPCP